MQTILFIIYRLYGGGAERVVSNLSQAFHGKYNIKIALFSDEIKTYPYKGELIRINLPFSKNTASNNKFFRLIRLYLLTKKLKQIKKQYGIDIAVSLGEQANITNVLSKGREHTCLSMRTTLSREMQHAPRMRILSGLIKRIYNHADALIVPSELAARDLISSFHIDESKLHVIYNYVDPLVIDQLCNEPISDRNHSELFLHPVLLNVGRITPAKGQWLMLHVLQRLRKQNSQLKFVIIGEGESEKDFKQKLVNYALNLGLKIYDSYSEQVFSIDYDVYLLGFDSNPFRYMKQSRLLVFPSTFEGFPNTVIEAMQSKLAVIAADCQSGPREILAPQTDPSAHTAIVEFADYGILAPSLPSSSIEDPVEERIIAEWIKAINALLEDPKLQTHYIEKGLQRASAFEKDIILQEWKEILDGIGQP